MAEAEVLDPRPHRRPLPLDEIVLARHGRGQAAKGDDILRKEWSGRLEIARVDEPLPFFEPGVDLVHLHQFPVTTRRNTGCRASLASDRSHCRLALAAPSIQRSVPD